MPEVLFVFQVAIEAAFALLAIRTVVSWVQHPDRRHANLAIALGSLAVLILLAPALDRDGPTGQFLTDLALVLFLISGYGLLMFRTSFVPFRPLTPRLLTAAIALVGLFALVLQIPANPDAPHTPFQTLVVVAIVGIWSYCVLEPIVTFWLASRGRPAVEKARLRTLSTGYSGLLFVIVVGTIAGALSPVVSLLLDLVALAIVPVLYVAFFPPAFIRRIWRQPEEDQFRHALHALLLYSDDRATLADRALVWAERLVGGEAACVLDPAGSILARRRRGIDERSALKNRSHFLQPPTNDDHTPWREGASIVSPLDLRQGAGAMVIVSGSLSPMFGDDEVVRLHQYATSISAGLDRVTLSSKIAALERAKEDFLNNASHELRWALTALTGYLTVLDAGALGDLSPKARSVLPLLISKSDEVNWMIEQMIEAARLEEGRLALKRHRTDIVELTDSAVEGVRILLSGHEVKLDSPAHPIDAEVDPDRFQIVVRNLLSNAAKYSAAGTDIDVAVRRDGDKAFVSVADRGVGISSEDQERLFTRFGRVTDETHVQGTGLGLWLSREIARMHDGDLTVRSMTGSGS